MKFSDLHRWTLLVFPAPGRYVSRDSSWESFDFRGWSADEYVWTGDPWNGLRDGVGLGFCWEWPYPWARHVVAYDEERVYSSGGICRESVGEYLDRSRYGYCWRRPLDG